MTECIAQLRLSFYPPKPVEVSFDAPEISSDGGAILLRQVDDQLGLSAWFAAAIPEPRDATRTIHERREQVRQRLYQIALGYEDCNDADTLRSEQSNRSTQRRGYGKAGSSKRHHRQGNCRSCLPAETFSFS